MNIVNWTVLTENQSCSRGKFSQDTQRCQLLREIQTTMEENRVQPEQFENRIIFISVHDDIDWKSRKHRNLFFEFFRSSGVRKKIP